MRARLPAWLRPGGQQAYRFHRLSTEEGLQGGAEGSGEEQEEGGAGAACEGGAGGRRPAGRWCPEEQAGLFSRLTFSYVGGLIRLGYRSAAASAPPPFRCCQACSAAGRRLAAGQGCHVALSMRMAARLRRQAQEGHTVLHIGCPSCSGARACRRGGTVRRAAWACWVLLHTSVHGDGCARGTALP